MAPKYHASAPSLPLSRARVKSAGSCTRPPDQCFPSRFRRRAAGDADRTCPHAKSRRRRDERAGVTRHDLLDQRRLGREPRTRLVVERHECVIEERRLARREDRPHQRPGRGATGKYHINPDRWCQRQRQHVIRRRTGGPTRPRPPRPDGAGPAGAVLPVGVCPVARSSSASSACRVAARWSSLRISGSVVRTADELEQELAAIGRGTVVDRGKCCLQAARDRDLRERTAGRDALRGCRGDRDQGEEVGGERDCGPGTRATLPGAILYRAIEKMKAKIASGRCCRAWADFDSAI